MRNCLFIIFILIVFSACKKPADPSDIVTAENELLGNITEDRELDPEIHYYLTGPFIVQAGARLTIPAGTLIESTELSTDRPQVRYIAVAQGAKISINGTAEEPVVMTSSVKYQEAWGGLVLCGYAPQNKAGFEGGASVSEVGDMSYGGSNPNDNSGIIRYLRVEYGGHKYTNEKEFNGISFFGVGSGTQVEYVSSYNCGDDGIEFFGGSVNTKYLVSIRSFDDGIDFTDGYTGKGAYWYVKDSFKSSVEGSNNGDNGASEVPTTHVELSHLTLIGSWERPYYFREGGGYQKIDNIVIGGLVDPYKGPYFYAVNNDAETIARMNAGDISVTNARFYEPGAVEKAVDGLQLTENPNATGAGNINEIPDWALSWALPKSD